MIRRLLALLCCTPATLLAQGTISGQAFGYPAGQFGARASATGGALAPFDAVSPVNPATVAEWVHGVLFFHVEPEFRSTSVGGVSSSTRSSRFPLVGGASRVSKNGVVSLTFSTYLDRTWETSFTTTESVETTPVQLTKRSASDGAINDLRLALGWSLGAKLRVGAGIHAYTGENRLRIDWDFPDSVPYGDLSQTSTLAYSGSAISAGTEWTFVPHATVAVYGRLGGPAHLHTGDTLVSSAHMPDHEGFSLRYDGISGTLIAAGWERIGWSSLNGLGSSAVVARDADRLSIGAETRGPVLAGEPVFLRIGAARRTLPFDVLGSETKESLLSFGTGFKLAKSHANIDLALQRAYRSAGAATEHAWLFSFGLAITP